MVIPPWPGLKVEAEHATSGRCLERVHGQPHFVKSGLLSNRFFLSSLTLRSSLTGSRKRATEHHNGSTSFGRPEATIASATFIVRNYARQLRNRLETTTVGGQATSSSPAEVPAWAQGQLSPAQRWLAISSMPSSAMGPLKFTLQACSLGSHQQRTRPAAESHTLRWFGLADPPSDSSYIACLAFWASR